MITYFLLGVMYLNPPALPPPEQLWSEEWLKARLPALLAEMRSDIEAIPFDWEFEQTPATGGK